MGKSTVICHASLLFLSTFLLLKPLPAGKILKSLKETVRDTAKGIKRDVETETGIPISEMEMRRRRANLRESIQALHGLVAKREKMDDAVIYLWRTLARLEEGDGQSLRKAIEYFEGVMEEARKDGVEEKHFRSLIQDMESHVLTLDDHRLKLPRDYDFARDQQLKPSKDDSLEALEDSEDPVIEEYLRLRKKYEKPLRKGHGYIKISARNEGYGATFSVIDPKTGDILARNAASNKSHRIRSGIFHLLLSVADAKLRRFNVVVLPKRIVRIRFKNFGTLILSELGDEVFDVYESKSQGLAYQGMVSGGEIVLPVGDYELRSKDGLIRKKVQLKKGEVERVVLDGNGPSLVEN